VVVVAQALEKEGAGIVAGKPVLLAWIAQANNQLDAITHGEVVA